MKSYDFLIIGGSAAGTTAAEMIRGLNPNVTITIVTDEDHTQYSRVLLPHYIRGKVQRDQVFLKKDDWYLEHKIELLKGNKVKSLDVGLKTVELSSGEKIQFGKLLISIGGYVIPLVAPGAESANICYMRTIENADKIIAEAKGAKSAVIIGGGFIGLEFCSCFKVNGVEEITMLVREPYFWSSKLDEDSSKVLVGVLERNGIKVLSGEEVDHFDGSKSVVTKSQKFIEADVVGVGIGIKSDFSFLDGSGIKINRAIVVDEYLESSIPDIYAAGDCAEFKDVIFERQHIMGNWSNATSQGAAVGKTIGGQKTVFETASSYTINFFDGSCTFIGVTDGDFADEVVLRGSVAESRMTRIFVKKIGGAVRIVGATVINNPADVGPLTMVIKGKNDISAQINNLAESSFALASLMS